MAFSDHKIGTGILVCNHLGIPLLGKVMPRMSHFKISYGELLAIIKGYVSGSILGNCIIVESNYLLAIKSLHSTNEDFPDLGALSSNFRDSIDVSSTSFCHEYR